MPNKIKHFVGQSVRTTLGAIRPPLEKTGVLDRLNGSESHGAQYVAGLFAFGDPAYLQKLEKPWWSFNAQDRIRALLDGGDKEVFEYGSGASTLWLSRRAKSVTSVEYDEGFHRVMSEKLADAKNTELILAPPRKLAEGESSRYQSGQPNYAGLDFEKFVKAVDRDDRKYDLIVIDGRARPQCLEVALGHLKEGGTVFFDDTVYKSRPHYRAAIEENPELQVEYVRGLRPASPFRDCAAFIRMAPKKLKAAIRPEAEERWTERLPPLVAEEHPVISNSR
jgi:Methyltransferase domain